MRFLKYVLSIICLVCVVWIALFLTGPFILKKAINIYYGEQVTAVQVRFTPKLDFSISRIDFNLKDTSANRVFTGFSRSIKFSWSLFDEDSFLRVSAGPTVVQEVVSLDNFEIRAGAFSLFSLADIPIKLNASNVRASSIWRAESLQASGMLNASAYTLADLTLNFYKFSSLPANEFSTSNIQINSKNLYLNKPFSQQTLSFEMFANEVLIGAAPYIIPELSATFIKLKDTNQFNLSLGEFNVPDVKGTVGGLDIQGKSDAVEKLVPIFARTSKASFWDNDLQFEEMTFKLVPSAQNFKASLETSVSFKDFELGKTLIGSLPRSIFSIDLNIERDLFGGKIYGWINLDIPDKENISANFNLTASYDGWDTYTSRLVDTFVQSYPSEFALNYEFTLSGETVNGAILCSKNPCGFENLDHEVITSNTRKIFMSLIETETLNSLFLAYLYSFILTGEPLGKGHKVNL